MGHSFASRAVVIGSGFMGAATKSFRSRKSDHPAGKLNRTHLLLLIREQLPFIFASTIDQNRGKKATLLRSPDRVIGLVGATRQISRTRTFDLSEAMALAYVKDSQFVLLTCLLQGLGVWCYLLPEPLSTASCSPECASAIKEAAQCQMRSLGFSCIHPNQIHEKVMDTFTKPEVFRQESKSNESVVSKPSETANRLPLDSSYVTCFHYNRIFRLYR
ncbi:hypothetical protein RIF29_24659 [Crotalaria pallida]|uniref:Uncharacterized protein n=1 Tax=Crotalaria pallida TaxID=3830 RepID=A0AAN9EK72_CROPI